MRAEPGLPVDFPHCSSPRSWLEKGARLPQTLKPPGPSFQKSPELARRATGSQSAPLHEFQTAKLALLKARCWSEAFSPYTHQNSQNRGFLVQAILG